MHGAMRCEGSSNIKIYIPNPSLPVPGTEKRDRRQEEQLEELEKVFLGLFGLKRF